MSRFLRAYADPDLWRAQAHLLGDLVFGLAWFTIVVASLATTGALSLTLVGLPLLVATVLGARPLNRFERARARHLLGCEVPSPFPAQEPAMAAAPARPVLAKPSTWFAEAGQVLRDGAAWRTFAYALVLLPWGLVAFTVLTAMWTLGLLGTSAPLWRWGLAVAGNHDVIGRGRVAHVGAEFVVGVGALVLLPTVVGLMAAVDRQLVRVLLGADERTALSARVEQLRESRDASVEGSVGELRRIERNLHDGAQQRLVAVAMTLGLARDRLDQGVPVDQVAPLVTQAHDEAKSAIVELRHLVRGIHPTVLSERGLDAALSALASRCPVPVDVDVHLERRPPAATEAAAYFVVAEALTNVAKHADATSARLVVGERDGLLTVEVTDDGSGGAAITEHGGLGGLRDRVAAVEGRLQLTSPPGGPTRLVSELPLHAIAGG